MKKKIQKLLDYIVKKGANILELLNQNYFIFFYSILIINLIFISFIFYKKLYILGILITLTLIIILKIEKLIKIGDINLYDKANIKIIVLNIILLILNVINIFFNVFRYIFYDFIKFIREFMRNILLNYFEIEITNKADFYIDNIIAYVSFDVVWVTIGILIYIYINYISMKYFDWKREDILIKNDELKAKLFWTHKNKIMLYIYLFVMTFMLLSISLIILKDIGFIYIDKSTFSIYVHIFICSTIIFFIFKIQFEYNYYKFHWKKNKEYQKWKE